MNFKYILILILFCSCGPYIPEPQNPIDINQALSISRQSRTKLNTLRAQGRIDHWAGSRRIAFNMYVLLKSPQNLRLEGFSPLDTTLSVFVSTNSYFKLINMEQSQCIEGQPTPENLSQYLGIPLKAADVATILMGATPVIIHTKSQLTWNTRGYYEMYLSGHQGWEQKVEIAPKNKNHVILRSEVKHNSNEVWRVIFSKFKSVDNNQSIPTTIHFIMNDGDIDTKIIYKSIEINPQLPEEAWSINCPWGSTWEHR